MLSYNYTFYNMTGLYVKSDYITLRINKNLKYCEAERLIKQSIKQFQAEIKNNPYLRVNYGIAETEELRKSLYVTYRKGPCYYYKKCKSINFHRSHRHSKIPFFHSNVKNCEKENCSESYGEIISVTL